MTKKPGSSSLNPPPEERREGLTLERFAEVMAYRKFFPPHFVEEVLLRCGIRPARWARAAAAWGEALAEAAAEEKPEIVLRFARAFGGTSRKLREWPPRLESLGEPIDPDAPDPEERAPERPSFMLDQPPSRAPQSAGSVWQQYAKPPAAAPVPAPAPAPAPAPTAPPIPARVPAPSHEDLGATRPAFRPPVKPPTMPFQMPPDASTPNVPPAPPAPPPPARTPGLGDTADVSSFVPRKPLPFQGSPPDDDKLAQSMVISPDDLRKGPGRPGR
ncbi:hypothetical protein [Polyangium sp. y55x31]|uniref:hypothetical protein n=1 Tax=Polyangium sp. y55x31 TaxID=3042688 RepID=UPI002482E4B1|nr:hypothetical protein [Polyangium sp. y55x31]MDI1479806.1 hypothetical protein [Polyangium sp. y55x31]